MATKKQKYYVVWKGHETGVFNSWADCQKQIKAFSGAEYKSFATKAMAEAAFHDNYSDHINKSAPKKRMSFFDESRIIKNSISVDAACSGNPGNMEYRGVDTYTKTEYFRRGVFKKGTNNVGEFLALVHCLAMCQKTGEIDRTIYSDSRIAMGWVKKGKANTKLKKGKENEILFELLDRAEQWLSTNKIKNPILKWETKIWGEIPADFGRK